MIDANDPRLTAFVLGELDDAERQEMEAAIEASSELQREVAAIQRSAELLQASLVREACPRLTDEQHSAIHAASAPPAVLKLSATASASGWTLRRALSLAVVASLLLAIVVGTAIYTLDFDRLAPTSVAHLSQEANKGGLRAAFSSGNSSIAPAAPDPNVDASGAMPLRDGYANYAADSAPRSVSVDESLPAVRFGPSSAPQPMGMDDRYGTGIDAGAAGSRGRVSGELGDREFRLEQLRRLEQTEMRREEAGEFSNGLDTSRPLLRGAGRVFNEDGVQGSPANRWVLPAEAASSSEPHLPGLGAVEANSPPNFGATSSDAFDPAPAAGPVIHSPEPRLADVEEKEEGAPEATRTAVPSVGLAIMPPAADEPPSNVSSTSPAKPVDDRILDLGSKLSEQPRRPLSAVRRANLDPADDVAGEDGAVDKTLGVSELELKESTTATDKKNRAAAGNQTTWTRARATPNASQLMIGDHDGLPLEGMQVNVVIDGFRARVLLDLYYYNNRGGRLEGNFKLRLPNEASLYYFAFGQSAYEYRPMVDQLASKGFLTGDLIRAASLDPHGILKSREGSWRDVKEARVVPREKAAHAYSETVRRRVDPALVEWSGAGVFNARVFPLMPNKLHRVVVGYDVNLQQQGDDLVYALDLPDDQGECVVDLNVSALPGVTADVSAGTRPFMSGGRAYYNFKNPANQAINVRFKDAGSMLLAGSDEQAGDFFVSRITPPLPEDEASASSSRAVFLVDTSLSSRPDKFNIWLDMLQAMLTENRDSIDEFAVLFFNIESHWWQPGYRPNNADSVAQLLDACHALSLEGATDLRQALREATAPEWARESAAENAPRPDLFLLSDGAVTWGDLNVHRLSETLRTAESGPLFAYQTGMTGTAVGTLEHLTRETGGAVFSVVNASEIPRVARAHRQRPWQLVDVSLPGGSDVLVAGRPKFIYPGQSLLVAGRGRPDAEAMVRVRRGDQQRSIDVTIDRTLDSALAPRVYGQVAVGQLEDLGSRIEDMAIAYARHFRVTGQTCSLLMLETEADYQRFNIKPEEDAFLVRTTPAADLIAAKLDELANQLGDAKAVVTNWLSKLESTPGLQFKVPTALRFALDRLPREAFEVETPRLVCAQRTGTDIPQEFADQLDRGQLDYGAVTGRASERFERHGAADALRTLSSLIENNPGDPVLTRDVAFSALEWGLGGQAYHLFQRVAELRPFEPQNYQAMSHCLAETGNADLAMVYYEVALNATWHSRYLDVKQIVGVEYVDLLRRIERDELHSFAREYAVARLESMRGRVPIDKADLVVTMMWNTDRTDVDLHVIEPTGEECYYEHPRTQLGGRMTRDVTEGFGPEMYTLPQAKAGDYRVLANYFGSDANRTNVRSKVYVTVYRNYGDPKRQWVEKKTITLADQKEKRELITVTIKP